MEKIERKEKEDKEILSIFYAINTHIMNNPPSNTSHLQQASSYNNEISLFFYFLLC